MIGASCCQEPQQEEMAGKGRKQECKATWPVHEVAAAQACDVHPLHEEHHAGQVGFLHFCWLKWPHVFGGKFFSVQTEKFSLKKSREMASVLLWILDGLHTATVPTTLPEGEDRRSCFRISAWLWLMGCRTRELALIRGLYTYNRNTAH